MTKKNDEKDLQASQDRETESLVPEEPLNDLEKALAEFPSENIQAGGTQREFDQQEIDKVVEIKSLTLLSLVMVSARQQPMLLFVNLLEEERTLSTCLSLSQ